jgi:hypothetical protein
MTTETTKTIETIRAGDRVRSYDFEGCDDCYAEGVVERAGRFDEFPDCDRYKILVDRVVFNGTADPKDRGIGRHVYPPVNGTKTWGGGVMNGVRKID